MHRIDTKTAQKDKFGAGKNGFTRGNPQTGTPATDLDDDYFDMLQEELCSVVEASGASLEKARHDQLLTALRALLLSRKNPFGDIKSDGTVQTALENLGLRDIALAGAATGMLGNAGYVALPVVIGGVKRRLILQFGLTPVAAAGAGTDFTCTLPTAFPTAFQRVFLCHDNAADAGVGFASGTVLTLSTFSFRPIKISQTGTTLTGQNAPISFHYLAIGYE
ncbi:TPA: hypothetical protein L1B78_001945 [Escherichia coli]|nr:hypothetical protein [Escherichia coli]